MADAWCTHDPEKFEGSSPPPLECCICSKPPIDGVATSCGHVFCWVCVYPLVADRQKRKACPACGTFLSKDINVLPLHCGGASSPTALPPRPSNPESFIPWLPRMGRSIRNALNVLDTSCPRAALKEIEEDVERKRAENERVIEEMTNTKEQWLKDKQRGELVRVEWNLYKVKSNMLLEIGRLDAQLADVANLLPNGWRDLELVDSSEDA